MSLSLSTARAAALWSATSAVGAVAIAAVQREVRVLVTGRAESMDQVLVGACAVAVVACATWAWLVTSAVVLEAARVVRSPLPAVPDGVRRLLLGACGVAVATGLTTTAHASDGGPHHHSDQPGSEGALHGLPYPQRAHDAGDTSPPVTQLGRVTVRPGDTLWDLAADLLPPTATAAEIDRLWRRVHRVNRSTIGPDPDLLHPGQRLQVPR